MYTLSFPIAGTDKGRGEKAQGGPDLEACPMTSKGDGS